MAAFKTKILKVIHGKYGPEFIAALGSLSIILIGVFIIGYQLSNKRSEISRVVRSWNGECYVEQMANDLADDIHHIPELSPIQPWAMAIMDRFRLGKVRTIGGNSLPWADDAVRLIPDEVPDFIKNKLGETNKLGDITPEIFIVITNRGPAYVVASFGDWGLAVGAPDYRVSFGPQWTKEVAAGIYTYGIER